MRIKGYYGKGVVADYVRKTMWFLFEDHSRSIKNNLRCRRSIRQALIHLNSNPYSKVRWRLHGAKQTYNLNA